MRKDELVFSRSGRTTSLGKNEDVMETSVPSIIKKEAETLAALLGKTRAEWLRDLIIREIRGELGRVRLASGLTPENPENSR